MGQQSGAAGLRVPVLSHQPVHRLLGEAGTSSEKAKPVPGTGFKPKKERGRACAGHPQGCIGKSVGGGLCTLGAALKAVMGHGGKGAARGYPGGHSHRPSQQGAT